ncbi:MAG: alcohol dehydrogenase catalytic domain-containing protein, partial [Acidimicrobiaceae bacterium]|nr:alcohol dehydrogenase catalytic domain-containing protein [Acidimicrobiaceae bacterium]
MRAAVLHEAPGDLVVEDLTIAEPIGREVLIRTKASGLCHSDLHVIEGLLPLPSLPAALGHEASGIVEAVGPDVTAFAPGDHVITCLTQFCGVCPECHVGRVFICSNRHDLARGPELEPTLSLSGTPVLPMAGLGAFAEQMLVHENGVVAVDPAVPFDVAALIGCAVMTGVGSATNGAQIRPGETVAVIGCGGIGLNIVQGCRLAGASRIIAVDLNAEKLEAARGFGATDVVDASTDDPVAAVQALTGGGVDAAFEA